jgi:hypothetical protein
MMFCGKELIKSVISVCPCSWISWLVTTVVGLVAEIFAGTGIRDPVTTTSSSCAEGSAAGAVDCWAATGALIAANAMLIIAPIKNILPRFEMDLSSLVSHMIMLGLLKVPRRRSRRASAPIETS